MFVSFVCLFLFFFVFFFQAEDGIRDCWLWLEFRRVLFRSTAVLAEYQKAPEVTRKRLYLEAMEEVLGDIDKIILDDASGGAQGIVPYLPLNELDRKSVV